MYSTSKNEWEPGGKTHASPNIPGNELAVQAEQNKIASKTNYDDNSQMRTSHSVLKETFEFLETLIPPERRITERPIIRLIAREGVAGDCKSGSPYIDVDALMGVTHVVPHESIHFWQFRDQFSDRLKDFYDRETKSHPGEEVKMTIVRYSMMEAAAYLFENTFLYRHSPQLDHPDKEMTDALVTGLCESFSQVSGFRLISAVHGRMERQQLTGRNELVGIADLSIYSIRKEAIDEEHMIGESSTNLGQAIALLVLAANNYDIKAAFKTLTSSPDEIIGTIGGMGSEKANELARRIESIAASEDKAANILIDATAPSA